MQQEELIVVKLKQYVIFRATVVMGLWLLSHTVHKIQFMGNYQDIKCNVVSCIDLYLCSGGSRRPNRYCQAGLLFTISVSIANFFCESPFSTQIPAFLFHHCVPGEAPTSKLYFQKKFVAPSPFSVALFSKFLGFFFSVTMTLSVSMIPTCY